MTAAEKRRAAARLLARLDRLDLLFGDVRRDLVETRRIGHDELAAA